MLTRRSLLIGGAALVGSGGAALVWGIEKYRDAVDRMH